MLRRFLVFISVLAVALSMIGVSALRASADETPPTLSPTQGPTGTQVTASATDWPGCSSMSVSGWGQTLGTAAINSAGAFTLSFTVPGNAAPGAAQLMFSPTCTHSAIAPFVTFTVTQGTPPPPSCSPSVSINPDSGPVGAQFVMAGKGWLAGGTVDITLPANTQGLFESTTPFTPTVGSDGTWQITVIVGQSPAGSYTFTFAESSCSSQTGTFTVTASPTASVPAAPSNLTATAVDPNDIKLTWTDNSNNETGFEINNGVTSSNAGANSTTYTWGGLAPGTYMCFKIRSYNSAGDSAWDPNVSPWYVCTTTPKPPPPPKTTVPAAPSNLTATAVDPNDIKLTWRDNSNNETGFEINNGVTSSNAGANSTTYNWGGLKPGTYMCFKIRSYNSAGDSAWDPKVSPSHVCTTTPKTEPQPNWAGWSWYPHQGTVSLISAEWKIPQVDCSAPPPPKKAPDISRTAVWVGLWGPNDAGNNRWLPQIGTASLCVAGIPRYFAIYQMYNGAGDGTTPNTLNLKGLQYGDTIQAKVSYAGRHQGRLQFNISIKDITRNSTAGGYIDTAPNVPLVDAAYQGGAIVEDNGDMGDLAKFDTPITIRNIQVTGDAGGARTRWAMVVSGNQIASTGDVRKDSFSVTWHNY